MDVIKTLKPGSPGTQRFQRRFGDRLIAVRYRRHAETGLVQTTVELVMDSRPENPRPSPRRQLPVQVDWQEKALQQSIRQADGRWDTARKVWWLSAAAVQRLGLEHRVAGKPQKV